MDLLWDYMNEASAAPEQPATTAAAAGVNPAAEPISESDIAFFAEATGKNAEKVAAKLKRQGVDIKEDATQDGKGENPGEKPKVDGQEGSPNQTNIPPQPEAAASPEKPPTKKDWRESLDDKEMAWSKRFTSYVDTARENLDRIAPEPTGDPESAEYKSADAYRKKVEVALRECERIDKLEVNYYDGDKGWFDDVDGNKANLATVTKTIVEAVRKSAKSQNELIDPGLDARFTDVSVNYDDGRKETGMIIDRTEVKGDVEILNSQARALVKKACETLGENKLVSKDIKLVNFMVTEFFSLTRLDSGLPLNVRYQMINDLIKRIGQSNSDVADALSGLTISYTVKDASGQEQIVSTSISQLESESQIRSKELLQLKPEDRNPIVARIKKTLTDKGFSEEDIRAFEAEAEKNGLDSWDYISDMIRMGFEYDKSSNSIAADFAQKLGIGKVTPKVKAFDNLAKDERFKSVVQSINQELVGSIKGVDNDMLRWAEENLKLKDIIKKLDRQGLKFKWEDWSLGLMFAYSFTPLMVEGEPVREEE